jgi:hypothetical protein
LGQKKKNTVNLKQFGLLEVFVEAVGDLGVHVSKAWTLGATEWSENKFGGVIWDVKIIKSIFRPEKRPWAAVVPVAGLVVPELTPVLIWI